VLTLAWGVSVLAADLALEAGLQGRVSFQGSALPRPGSTVLLQGFGSAFDGAVTVRECHQRMTDGMWTTDLTVERRP
jgi:phage protein D